MHATAPVRSVVPEQVCADVPLPRVKVTVRPPIPVPVGSSVVSTPERVSGCPFWAVGATGVGERGLLQRDHEVGRAVCWRQL